MQEILSAGGRTVWGDPADIAKVLEGASFDVVLDNNGKDLDAARHVHLLSSFQVTFFLICCWLPLPNSYVGSWCCEPKSWMGFQFKTFFMANYFLTIHFI